MNRANSLMMFILVVSSSIVHSQNATVTVTDNAIGYNEGVGVNINFGPSVSWSGATYLAQMCRTGSFEGNVQSSGDDIGVITGWKKVPQSSGAAYSAETANPYTGNQAQKIVINNAGEGLQNWALKYKLNTANQYTIRFALRAENDFNSDIDLRIRYWNTNNNQNSPKFTPTTQWKEFEWTFTPNQNDELGELYIYANGPGTIYIDDFEFYITGNRREDGFDKKMVEYLEYFKPASLRWGAIPGNFVGFDESTEPSGFRDGMSYGQFFKLCEEVDAKANLCIGVHEPTDYYKDKQTVVRLLEYIGGPASTTGGGKRNADGFTEFLPKGKNFIIEFGNEVWGGSDPNGVDHGSPWTNQTRLDYMQWCRERMSLMRQNQYFDPNKYTLAYCGRQVNYQWWDKWDMINGENGEGDWWSVSGYMGGNFQDDIGLSSGQLNYYMSGFSFTEHQKSQVKAHYDYMQSTIGKKLPLFMYEGNFDRSDYFNKLGQALIYLDYSVSMIKEGVQIPTHFIFAGGGQWAMVNNMWGNYKREPLYYAGALLNRYCKGDILSSSVSGGQSYTHPAWSINNTNYPEQTWNTVAHYAFKTDSGYAVLLINRDYENDQDVNIEIPANNYKDTASLHTLTGNDWNAFNPYDNYNNDPEVIKITHNTIQNFSGNSATVTLPKHSALVVSFHKKNTATGINKVKKITQDFSLYVHPDNGLMIRSAYEGKAQLSLFTISGKKVFNKEIYLNGSVNDVSIPELSKGLYLTQLSFTDHAPVKKKIFIQAQP